MRTAKWLAVLLSCTTCAVWTSSVRAEAFFSDGFESGDRSKTSSGFIWSQSAANVFVSPSVARSGSHSLCFKFTGKPVGSDSTAEQRFVLGAPYTELWIKFHIRFPENYRHRSDSPSNNKMLMLWSREYTDYGNQAGLHLWAGGNGNSLISYTVGPDSPHFPRQSQGGMPTLVALSSDLGKWLGITYHWKRQSTATSADGIVEAWRESSDGTKSLLFSHTNLTNTWGTGTGAAPADNFLDKGYLMGWANSGFDEDTTICIDDVSFSGTPFDEEKTPKPPTEIVIN